MAAKRIPLKYKMIAHVVTWLVALFATNPNGKYWPLVYMFPLGLAAFANQHSGGWGLHRNLFCSSVLLFPLAQSLVDAPSVRWPGRFAHL